MLSLIGREVYDHLVYVLACCLVSAITIGVMILTSVSGIVQAAYAYSTILILVLFVGFCALGAAQMYGDRANRISALLSTLAVTRSRILAARVLVGVLTLLASLIPVLTAALILLSLAALPAAFYPRMIWEVSAAVALTGFACYCIGLEIGWTTSKTWLILGSFLLVALLASLVFAKGPGLEAIAILLLFIAAMLVHTWHKFTSASF